jgi:2,4-didehydro-3-deoxy-L-rhamnonate hydrolase
MRIANYAGRAVLVRDGRQADIEKQSDGALPSDLSALLDRWADVQVWAATYDGPWQDLDETQLRCPVPAPRQVFAIGLNYQAHLKELGISQPEFPATFTKFPSCIAGPNDDIEINGDSVDWEVELVAVIGRRSRHVTPSQAWAHIAALTVGQDISDRVVMQRPPTMPQVNLGKSFPTYGPIGPLLVSPDEFDDPDDIVVTCTLNAEQVQQASTADLIFSIPQLTAYLSSIVTLFPGDLIFTGTPSGVGATANPPRFLAAGDELVSEAGGIGILRNRCIKTSS